MGEQIIPVRSALKGDDPFLVIGEARLEERTDGSVYAHISFNDSLEGDVAKHRFSRGNVLGMTIIPDHTGDAAAKKWQNATIESKENN